MTLTGKKYGKAVTYSFSLISIALWGMSYIWSDRILSLGIPVEYFLPFRTLMAGTILFLVNLVMGYSMRIRKADALVYLLLAFCEPFIYFFCETYGIKLTESPTISALVIATTPIFSVVFAFLLFREKVTWLNVAGILVCLGGLALVTRVEGGHGPMFLYGILVLLIAVFAEVGHAACTKKLSDGYRPTVIVMYQFLFGTLYFLPMFLTRGLENFDPALYLSVDFLKPLLALAILCSSVAFSLWAFTIKELGVAKSSIFLAMIPLMTAIWGFLLGAETLGRIQWLGLGIACMGIILSQWDDKKGA